MLLVFIDFAVFVNDRDRSDRVWRAALYVIFQRTTQNLLQSLCDALAHVSLMLILILNQNLY